MVWRTPAKGSFVVRGSLDCTSGHLDLYQRPRLETLDRMPHSQIFLPAWRSKYTRAPVLTLLLVAAITGVRGHEGHAAGMDHIAMEEVNGTGLYDYGYYNGRLTSFGGYQYWLGMYDEANHENQMCVEVLNNVCGGTSKDKLEGCCTTLGCQPSPYEIPGACGLCDSKSEYANMTVARWCGWNEAQYQTLPMSPVIVVHALLGSILVFVAAPLGVMLVSAQRHQRSAMWHKKFMSFVIALAIFTVLTATTFADGTSGHAKFGWFVIFIMLLQGAYPVLRKHFASLKDRLSITPHRVLGVTIVAFLLPLQWIFGWYHLTHVCDINGGQCSSHVGTAFGFIWYSLMGIWGARERWLLRVEVLMLFLGGFGVLFIELARAHYTEDGHDAHYMNDWNSVKWQHVATTMAWSVASILHIVHIRYFPEYASRGIAPAIAILIHTIFIVGHAKPDMYNTLCHRVHAFFLIVAMVFRMLKMHYTTGVCVAISAFVWASGSLPAVYYARYIGRLPHVPYVVIVMTIALAFVLIQTGIRALRDALSGNSNYETDRLKFPSVNGHTSKKGQPAYTEVDNIDVEEETIIASKLTNGKIADFA